MANLLLDGVLTAANTRAKQILPILEGWVRENSYSANVEGVNRVGDRMSADFDMAGLTVTRHAGEGVGDHLVWTTPRWTNDPSRRVLLVGHHDTVFPAGAFDVWETSGDRLRGPGVLDMKGGLATVWATFAALADLGLLADVPVALVSVGDEEIGSRHSAAMVSELAAGASAALVFEAGRAHDRIITRRKGTGGILARAVGKAAHAGNFHAEGRNAIWAIAQLVDAAQRITDYEQGVTVNVGIIKGGEARNTVPELAECAIDIRFEKISDGEKIVGRITEAAAGVEKITGAKVTIEGGIRRPPLERSAKSAALYAEYAECAIAAGLGGEESLLLGGGSDANNISALGVPCIDGLGPRGQGFHTHDEYIELPTLVPKTQALARFLVGRTQNGST